MVRDAATCSDYQSIQLHHVDLDMDVDFQSQTITGHATLWMKRLAETNSMELKLDVFHLEIQDVQAKVNDSTLVSISSLMIEKFTSFGDALLLELPSEVAILKEFQLLIKYQTKQTSPGVCWLDKEQTAGKKHPYLFTQGQEVLNRSFFPCQDSPSVRVTYTANVHVPKDLVCVMSAKSLGFQEIEGKRLFRFEMRQSIPIYLVAMAIGDLVSAPVGPRSSVWTEPCMLEVSQKEFEGEIEKYLQIGERLFGAYQWEQYDVLVMPPSFPYGGMENPRLTFLSPTIVTGDKSLCSVVAHEISHSWFGNLVTNSSWSEFFMNEGFTMYAERRLTEEVFGREHMSLDAKLGDIALREEIANLGEDNPLTRLHIPLEQGIDPGDCFTDCPYEKGYDFVCYLRSLVDSQQTFDDFLKAYCKHFRFHSITAEKMMHFYLNYFPHLANDSQTDLKDGHISFQTWLHRPGLPLFTPDYSPAQSLMEDAENLAFHWKNAWDPVPSNVLFLTLEAKKNWGLDQIFYFLDLCFEFHFSQKEVASSLGETLELWSSRNSETMYRWVQVIIKNELNTKLDYVGIFLKMQGKQKYHVPVYRLLADKAKTNHIIQKFASKIYKETKRALHVMVRDRIEQVLSTISN